MKKCAIINRGRFPTLSQQNWSNHMIQICKKDREKVYDAIRTGKIDAAEMAFPNLIDDNTTISLLISSCALLSLQSSNSKLALLMSLLPSQRQGFWLSWDGTFGIMNEMWMRGFSLKVSCGNCLQNITAVSGSAFITIMSRGTWWRNWPYSHASTYWTAQKSWSTWTMTIMKSLLWWR